MGKVIFVPIERIDRRYSNQWFDWFMASFKRFDKEVLVVGDTNLKEIKVGQFLDVYDTNSYKLGQLQEIIELLKIHNDIDCIFFMDYWFPGVEALAYIRDNARMNFRIKGMLHAGTYDDYDFITQNGCGVWGEDFEKSILKIADEVFVGSQLHRQEIVQRRGELCKITVVDYPVYECSEYLSYTENKENIVIFPHRLGKDKQPELFKVIEEMYKDKYPYSNIEFIRTLDYNLTKGAYYTLLAKSKAVISFATHELFGIAMLEAVNLKCYPIAPNRLAYKETLKEYPLYNTLGEAVDLIRLAMGEDIKFYPMRYSSNVDNIISLV
jgi:hypothetical protein